MSAEDYIGGESRPTEWVDVEVIHLTEKAVLVSDGKKKVWLPLSAIVDQEDELTIGIHTKVEISTRLAEEKGLV